MTPPPIFHTLASIQLADGIQLAIAGLFLVQLVQGAISVWAGMKVSKIDKLEEKVSSKAEQLIDAKFQTLAAEMNKPIAELAIVVSGMRERLADGDDAFEKQGDRAQALEVQLKVANEQIKAWAIEKFATRQDLEHVLAALQRMQVALARCEAQSKLPPTSNN